MIKSMTAYARREQIDDTLTVIVEMRSYNSRYLDVVLRISHAYIALEDKIKTMVGGKVSRGRVEISLQIKEATSEANTYEVNTVKAKGYLQAVEQLKKDIGLEMPISLNTLLSVGDIIKPSEQPRNIENAWTVISTCMQEALGDLDGMRIKEGAFIEADFNKRLTRIADILSQIKRQSSNLIDLYKDRLSERIQALTKGLVEIDNGRIAQEAAFLADRSDITEEVVRAASHIEQFRKVMEGKEPAGRKLNFLLQEMNREFNTMGSKAEKASVSHLIVEVKSELEKLREQVQNIE